MVGLVLDRDGVPTEGAAKSSTLYDARASACTVHSLHTLKFSPAAGLARLEITFELEPKKK